MNFNSFTKILATAAFIYFPLGAQANNPYDMNSYAEFLEKGLRPDIIDIDKKFLNDNEKNIFINLAMSEITPGGLDLFLADYIDYTYPTTTPSYYSNLNQKRVTPVHYKWTLVDGYLHKTNDGRNLNSLYLEDINTNDTIQVELKSNAHILNKDPKGRVNLFCKEKKYMNNNYGLHHCVPLAQLKEDMAIEMVQDYSKFNNFATMLAWYTTKIKTEIDDGEVHLYNPYMYIYYSKALSFNGFKCNNGNDCIEQVTQAYRNLRARKGSFLSTKKYLMDNYKGD